MVTSLTSGFDVTTSKQVQKNSLLAPIYLQGCYLTPRLSNQIKISHI